MESVHRGVRSFELVIEEVARRSEQRALAGFPPERGRLPSPSRSSAWSVTRLFPAPTPLWVPKLANGCKAAFNSQRLLLSRRAPLSRQREPARWRARRRATKRASPSRGARRAKQASSPRRQARLAARRASRSDLPSRAARQARPPHARAAWQARAERGSASRARQRRAAERASSASAWRRHGRPGPAAPARARKLARRPGGSQLAGPQARPARGAPPGARGARRVKLPARGPPRAASRCSPLAAGRGEREPAAGPGEERGAPPR